MLSGTGLFLSGDGRMGMAIRPLVEAQDPCALGLVLVDALEAADVVIDYSHPDWTGPLLTRLLHAPRPVLIGTTGLTERMKNDAAALALRVPVMLASNTGTGVQVLRRLVAEASRLLGEGWDVEVLEMHHGKKVDAPSGTAWTLVDEAAAAIDARSGESRGRKRAVPSRLGEVGARTAREIGVQSLRGGDVVGEHTVFFVGHGERIEITHRCWDRSTFARGGLRIARWLASPHRPPGLYAPGDSLL